ncbi:hypothetical protein N9B71_05710 [Pirellulales bacterium]|nr:hypothetical protein [Pirellulales bacterium]
MKMLEVRRLNEVGLDKARGFFEALKVDLNTPLPQELLGDDAFSDVIDKGVARLDEALDFSNRFDLGKYLVGQLQQVVETNRFERDCGLWTWVTLVYFDQICPLDDDGSRTRVSKYYHYYLVDQWPNYYRHRVAQSYQIFKIHGDASWVLLCNPLSVGGEIIETFSGRQRVVETPATVKVIDKLYRTKSGYKKGAAGRGKGSANRLNMIMNQFSLTYDLWSMTEDELISLLPKEFDWCKE